MGSCSRPRCAQSCAASIRTTTAAWFRPLLAVLAFRSNNTAYQPVMQVIELLGRYSGVDGKVRHATRFRCTVSCPGRGRTPWSTTRAGSSGAGSRRYA